MLRLLGETNALSSITPILLSLPHAPLPTLSGANDANCQLFH
jgi:hypothetical protein